MQKVYSGGSVTRGWISGMPALLAFVLIQAVAPCWADARLENFQLPAQTRIAGQYEIVFKAPAALAALVALQPAARAAALKGAVLPGTLPISDADVHALATAIAASIKGRSLIIFPASNGAGGRFTVSGVTEASMRALAADPRIEVIEASSSAFNDSCE
jgi:hypothetical protein